MGDTLVERMKDQHASRLKKTPTNIEEKEVCKKWLKILSSLGDYCHSNDSVPEHCLLSVCDEINRIVEKFIWKPINPSLLCYLLSDFYYDPTI